MSEPRRTTLLNPHADDFTKTPVSFWLVRRRGLGKYAYLIDEPIRQGQRVDVLVDGTLSSICNQNWFCRFPRWLRAVILKIEVRVWIAINGLGKHVQIHWSANTIDDRSALYIFSYKNCVGAFAERKILIDKFNYKIVNMSHYFVRTSEKARNIATLDNVIFAAESDLRHNNYLAKYFSTDIKLIVLPFAVSDRFTAYKPIAERNRICAATGTFHNLHEEMPAEYYQDFIRFFRLDTYHPVRKLLYARRNDITSWLDSRISLYREKSGRRDPISRLLSFFRLDVSQSEYFAFDIVEFYNNHKFAIAGEEASGSPTIGFFEAMACGCVVLGEQGSFYDGLGIEPGIHYLIHDGSLDGIWQAIESALATPGKIEQVSSAGKAYIAENATPAAVWNTLQRQLADIVTAS